MPDTSPSSSLSAITREEHRITRPINRSAPEPLSSARERISRESMIMADIRTNVILQPVTNKRNASLLAKAMEEGLGVAPDRGLIKFVAIAKENLATNRRTLAGDIEELEKENGEDNSNLKRNLLRANKNEKRQSIKSLRNLKSLSHLPTHNKQLTPPLTTRNTNRKSGMDRRAEKAQKMGRRRSFIATIFGKA
ncbi:hypothetical protein B0J14DRAFT_622100 [Halenospora varia]|nr:hypothetical protein B0J14DRAFT_622100 [Halenospora varia]